MVAPGGIRAGLAYVEITADDTPMQRRLQASQARLRQWVAQNSAGALTRGTEASVLGEGGKGFLGGGFRGTELFDTGLKLATAIAATKVAIKDVQIFASLFRGDMEGARKVAEELPFGLGAIVKELSGPVDAAMKAFVFRLKGIEDTGPQRSDRRARLASVEQYNRGVTAINAAQKALDRATMSARDYAKAEVDGLNLAAKEAERLLSLKLRLIEVDEQRKAFAEARATLDRGEGLVTQAMDQYAKATMSEREFLAYEVRHLGLAEHHAQSLLSWRQAILDVTEKQAAAERRLSFDESLAGIVENLRGRIAELRGELDALSRDEKRATEPLLDAFAVGTIDFTEFRERVAELQGLFADLRAAQEQAGARQKGEALTEAMKTPEERAKGDIAEYKRLLEGGQITDETYRRAVRKAVEEAAAALPDVARATVGARGTFSAIEAATAMGAGGVQDRIAAATAETAQNTARLIEVAQKLGVTFS